MASILPSRCLASSLHAYSPSSPALTAPSRYHVIRNFFRRQEYGSAPQTTSTQAATRWRTRGPLTTSTSTLIRDSRIREGLVLGSWHARCGLHTSTPLLKKKKNRQRQSVFDSDDTFFTGQSAAAHRTAQAAAGGANTGRSHEQLSEEVPIQDVDLRQAEGRSTTEHSDIPAERPELLPAELQKQPTALQTPPITSSSPSSQTAKSTSPLSSLKTDAVNPPLPSSSQASHGQVEAPRAPSLESPDAHPSLPPPSHPDQPSADGNKPPAGPPPNWDNYPRWVQRTMASMPHITRPTREAMLNAASGFWERLRIHWRWMALRSFRKFNADDFSAFLTWFVMSQTIWILVGTTSFLSAVFWLANSLSLQHYIAKALSDYLTRGTDIMIVFESAIVPKWRDSKLCFKNVYISRGPHTTEQEKKRQDEKRAQSDDEEGEPGHPPQMAGKVPEQLLEEYNYTMFDLNVDSVDVTLSLWRWLDGKGLVKDAVVKGVRGAIDRRSIHWDPENPLNPADFRHKSQPGDFELESLQMEDVLVTVYQPDAFRPYTASIFRADFPIFRKQWLFYDFLSADSIVGQFDNCLFSLHKPQSIGRTNEADTRDSDWARMSRVRIDGVNIDHLQRSTSSDGPFSWITSGKVDAVLDIKFPHDPEDELPFQLILGELADAISEHIPGQQQHIPGQRELAKPPLSAPDSDGIERAEPCVVIDIDLRFRDVKASVPIFTNDISVANNALIRPIVAFMNANHTLVPIRARVVKDLSEFDGAWTMWETGLMDDISDKIYNALAYHVTQANMNKRLKTVGLWSVQMTASAVLSALRRALDPISLHLRETYTIPLQNAHAMYELLMFMPQI
ncbi:hypothetical protein FB107DRAFT_259670 [Schizophyllum commune]